jgi:DNA-binding transcriptional LysR family regulator
MDRLAAMEVFIRVAEAGSFSAAARQLGVGQPAISKMVAQLEETLGARLMVRTTRSAALTEDGRRFLEAARHAVDAADAATQAVAARGAPPSGVLRIAASVAFARLQIVPRLAAFLTRYPGVEVDLVLSDRFIDLIEEGIDVAIRIGELKDPGLVARRIGRMARITVARPDYWNRRGRPRHPTELAGHDCVIFTGLASGDLWQFEGADGPIAVKVTGRVRASTSDAMREAVLEGLGVGVTPYWMWRDEVRSGALERVLIDFEPTPRPIQAVFPERRLVSAKVRAFVDFLSEEFRLDPRLSDYGSQRP